MPRRSRFKSRSYACARGARPPYALFALLLLLLGPVGTPCSSQGLDETRQRFAAIQAAISWENVTRSGNYLRGAKPEFLIGEQLEIVRLQPGASIEFFVPAHELVRVVRHDGKRIMPDAVEFWTSNGSGLYRKQNVALTADLRSCVAAPDQSSTSIAKVARPATATGCIDVAIYISRRANPRLLDYYQCAVPNGRTSAISDGTAKSRKYTFFPAGGYRRLEIRGGRRLRIESRLKYNSDVQRRQTFWVSVYVNGELQRVLSMDTQPHSNSRQFVDGCETLLGRREFAYVDLDCGNKQIEIRSSHDAYIRVDSVGLDLCRGSLNRNFDLPDWRNPEKAISIWQASDFDPSTPELGNIFASDTGANSPVLNARDVWDPYLNQQAILRLARNNRVPHSGLRAYMWMRAIASLHFADVQYGDEVSVPELAERIRRRYTLFRTLLPQTFGADNEPKQVAFHRHPIRLVANGSNCDEVTIGQQHVEDALGALSRTTMVRVPKGIDSGLTYQLPNSLGDTIIRFVVDQTHLSKPARFLVQYDQRPPIHMAIMPRSSVAAKCLAPASSQAALSALANIHKPFDSGAVGGPFAMTGREPTTVIKAATASLFKPADVTQVRVSLIACDGNSINVGMQYLDGSQTRLSESAYRHLRTVATQESPDSRAHAFALRELENDGVELELFLKARYQSFSDPVDPSNQVDPPKKPWSDSVLAETYDRAQDLIGKKQWPEAIKLLTQIIRHSDGTYRRLAVMQRIDALLAVNEFYLAGRELRGWIKYGNDSQLRLTALRRLIELNADDNRLREELLSVAAIEIADPKLEYELASQLLKNGRFSLALRTLTSHVPNEENHEILLRCSYQLGWWKLFDEAVAYLDDIEQRSLWTGLKQLRQGDYSKARVSLENSGELGGAWREHWNLGAKVFERLGSRSASVRLSALRDWERFQLSHPGPYQWKSASGAVSKCAGSTVVYQPSRNVRVRHFVTDPGRPTEIVIHGPVKLKIEARPVHAVHGTEPINDWLTLRSDGNERQLPVVNNRRSQNLKLDDTEDFVPGALVTTEIDIPPGLNRFTMESGSSLILFRVMAQRPEIAMPFLPSINSHTLASVIKGSFAHYKHACGYEGSDRIRLVDRTCKCRSCMLSYNAVECSCNELHSAQHHFNQLPYAIAKPWHNRVHPTDFSLVQNEADDLLMNALEIADLDEPVTEANEHIKLLQLAKVQQIVAMYPNRDEIRSTFLRLKRGFAWEQFRQFDRRAGVRTVPIDGWTPESPGARIRGSMMLGSPGHVLSSSKPRLQISVMDDRTTKFRITARRPQIGFLPTTESVVQVRARGKTHDMRLQDPDQTLGIGTQLAPGAGVIEVEFKNPLTNHFVQVFVDEYLADGTLKPLGRSQIDSGESSKRKYHVATQSEPLVFRVKAPAVLRIDRLEGQQTRQEFVSVLADKTFTLAPTSGQKQELYRIFRLAARTDVQIPQPELAPATLEEIPLEHWSTPVVQTMYREIEGELAPKRSAIDLLSLVPPDVEPSLVSLDDHETLASQSQGTWAAQFGYQQRRALEEFPNASADDRFLELNYSRLLFDEFSHQYSQSDLVIRPRFDSGVVLGVKHQGSRVINVDRCGDGCPSDWGGVQLDWQGYVYSQIAAPTVTDFASETPWIGGFRTAISRGHDIDAQWNHRPKLLLFGRGLSESRNGYEPGGIDQDIFTNFKSDHRYGLILSDKFVYQSCLDKRYWLRPTLMTNENEWVPDNLGIQFGTDQLLGPLQVKLAYRLSNYLEDDDRQRSSLQNVVYADLMWEHWQNQNRRSEFNFTIRSSLDNGQTSFGFNIISFANHARGYRDIRPGASLFRRVRNERYASQFADQRGQ